MFKAIEALSKRFDSLGTNMERKLDLVNVNVMNMSERTTALEMKDNQDSMFKAIEALSKRFDSLGTNMESCPLLKNPKNGFSHSHKNCTGEFISFSCNRSYWLNGPSERLCLNNGSWTGVQPTCEFGKSFTR
ncbi:unnamed protein product [Pocillopora meandrina]|uniref:Sushi domain-containing protein n=1 Tax=Pocillopora meandrina TaxID=46732 RepID=A0AAU9Y6P9_9CNID|nr:unnamed protein product [Pocillopora meandrina]